MQSENPAPSTESTSTSELDPPSRSNEPLKLSTRPSPEPSATNEPLSNVSRTSLDPPSEHTASSRNAMEMNHSSPQPEPSASTAIKYTRTGRISKAAKGQRVHHCDECGKTYTRAEHLRRHQQNHKPGAYPCDVPGCGRSFHREDLLMRHKARHNDPSNTPSRAPSVVSGPSAPEVDRITLGSVHGHTFVTVPPPTPAVVQHISSSTQQDPPSTTASRTPKRMIPLNELGTGNMAISVAMGPDPLMFPGPFPPHQSISPPTVYPDGDDESSDDLIGPPHRTPQYARSRYPSDSSFLFSQPLSSCRSPHSSSSSTIIVPQVFNPDARYSSDGSALMHGYGFYHRQSIPHLQHEIPPSPEQRDIIEQENFRLPSGFLESDDIYDPVGSSDNEQCLQAYWSCVHELFPVVHFPTYNHQDVSPLLRTAILALGGQAVGNSSSVQHARVLHEKCLKVLRWRTMQDNHSYRTCDLQAIVLVEVYALFKSRRPPLQFSKWFEKACSILCNDPEATISGLGDTTGETDELADPFSHLYHKLDVLCKQRLLLACYLLEQQHNLLFGRSTTCLGDIGSSLPFPSIQQRWDVLHYQSNCADELACDSLADAVTISTLGLPEHDGKPCDIFQTLLIQARLGESVDNFHDYVESSGLDNPLSKLSGRARLTHDIFVLCKMTPIRHLLAVAGESWIMAEKLSSQDEFMAAQREVREWAMQDISNAAGGHSMAVTKPAVQYALEHALSILEVHREFPRSGLHFQEWAVYLAAVVVWVRGYVRRDPGLQRRLSVTNTNEPTRTAPGLDQTVKQIIGAGSAALYSWEESRDVLRWAESKIKQFDIPHNSGLVSGALDVLGKLIMRGNEDGWC